MPRTGLPHIFFDEVPYGMAILYTLELSSLRIYRSHVAHTREHLHDFMGFFNIPVGTQEMIQPLSQLPHETYTPP